MKNLIEKVLETKAKNIKRMPCYTNRASSLGYFVPELDGCLRRGVYTRTNWQEAELHDARTQLVFDEGNNQEAIVLRDLAEAGIQIIEQQTMYEWKMYQISGHLDGKYVEDGIAYPVEIKSMSPMIFDIIHTWEDLKKKPWTRAYQAQLTLYMLMQGIDKGILIAKNKSTGNLKQITCDLDYELGEACLRTAEAINKHITDKTLPDRTEDRQTCKKCPFKMLCLPDLQFGEELKIVDDPLYEKRLERYFELEEQSKECKAIYEIIRDEAKAQAGDRELNILVGKYRLTGKKDAKGSFRLKIEPMM